MKVYFQRGEHHARGHPTALGKADDARGLPGSPWHATKLPGAGRCCHRGTPSLTQAASPAPQVPLSSGLWPPARKHAAGSGRLRPEACSCSDTAPGAQPAGDSGARALGPQEPPVFVKRGHKRSGGQRARRRSWHLHATPPAAAKPASETVSAPTSCSEKTE